ncbi:DUF3108 domain-containing protein [Tardiphaga sp.]|jgi:hypothetical protein|uniref:DUF3108 domain-containing protein n=1 Tax=Tardiphaga sp. TaxID=1926292 RepID=UPI0037DA2191
MVNVTTNCHYIKLTNNANVVNIAAMDHSTTVRLARPKGRFTFNGRSVVVCAALSSALLTAPAAAQEVRARYALRYIDISVGSIATFSQLVGGAYRAGLDGQQAAYLSVLTSFRGSLRSDGVVRKGELLPRAYAATETTGGVTYRTEVKFDARNATAIDIQPAMKDADERVPVEVEHTRNVMDPSSALMMPIPEGAPTVGPAACERTLRIFSGAHRSDIALSYLGTENMQNAAYTGPVTVCSARLVMHAGHKPAAYMTRFMSDNKGIVVKLAPVSQSRFVVLAGVTVPLPLGTLSIVFEEFNVSP